VRLSFNNADGFPVPNLMPLALLRPGQTACIDHVLGRSDEVHRLNELGMRAGTVVEMVQSGSPCIVKLGGAKVCFRSCEATSVLVRLGDAA
jgi:ferrous iron transport protein A